MFRSVQGNAVWAHDSSAVLVLETAYATNSPEMPYWQADVGHFDYRQRALVAENGELDNLETLVAWPDEHGDHSGGWMQSASIYWHRGSAASVDHTGPGRLFYIEGDAAVVRSLKTGNATTLSLPATTVRRYFSAPLDAATEAASPHAAAVLPSPNGAYTGVLYTLAYTPKPGSLLLSFLNYMAFFDADGSYIGGAQPDPARYELDNFKLFLPPRDGSPIADGAAPPKPAMPLRRAPVDALREPHFLWHPDSTGVYLVARMEAEPSEPTHAFFVSVAPTRTPAVQADRVARIPEYPVAAPSGAYSEDGELLMVEEDRDQVPVRLYTITDDTWVAFGEIGLVTASITDYGS